MRTLDAESVPTPHTSPITSPNTSLDNSPVSATDRLLSIYRAPGPYASVYVATLPLLPSGGAELDVFERWPALRRDLETQGATPASLSAIEARLSLPAPDDTAGVAVIAAADGTTIVDHGLEPPAFDLATVDAVPYAAPLLEWQQRRIAHLVVTIDGDGADLAVFGLDHYTDVRSHQGGHRDLLGPIAETALSMRARLIVLHGEPQHTTPLAQALATELPATCHIVEESGADEADELAERVVRHVSHLSAADTVELLRDQRFMASHHAAVDGVRDTVRTLRDGTATRLVLHDDPTDQRRLWIGDDPTDLSLDSSLGRTQARLIDALIRSAVLQGIPIHIVPATGPTGPDDHLAALADRSDG